MKKSRSSAVFVGATLLLIGLVWAALWLMPRLALSGFNPVPVKPGRIDLIAVHPESGYRIVVSNGIAHLVEFSGSTKDFDVPDDTKNTENAARLPIRETLQALQGQADALGKMVMAVNKIRDEDFPNNRVVWKAEDIVTAIKGDPATRARLEKDLNTRLDGTPLDSVSLNAITSGIVIDSPVKVKVPIEGKESVIECRIQEPYKTLFVGAVQKHVDERFNVTREALAGLYKAEAMKIIDGGQKEGVVQSLEFRIAPEKLREKAANVEKILAHTRVLVNENQMRGASYVTVQGANRSILANVTLRLDEDGRMRLWKYSHEHLGFQLMLTFDGVAIAAPRIKTELAESEVNLTNVPSLDDVKSAVDFINQTAAGKK